MVNRIRISPKARAWLVVVLLFIVGMLNYLDRTMISTMRISIIESIPMTDAQFGLLTSVFLWVYGILSPFAGFIADRFSRSKVIVASLFLWSFVTWLTSQATSYHQLLATRALMGVCEAFYLPAALALIMDYHKGETQSRATGLHMAGVMVGQSLGFIGGMLAENNTWGYAFHVFGIVGVIYSIILLLILKDAPKDNCEDKTVVKEGVKEKDTFSAAIKNLCSQKSFIFLFIFWGIMGIVGWLVMAWLPTFYQEKFSLSQSTAGFYATAYLYPASIVGLIVGSTWADRWHKKNPYARILVPIAGLGIASPAVFLGSATTILPLTITLFLMYGLTRNFVDTNLMPILCLTIDERYRSTGYGVLNMFGTIIGGVGIYAAGLMRDSNLNLNTIYQIAAVGILLCIFLLWEVKKNIKLVVK